MILGQWLHPSTTGPSDITVYHQESDFVDCLLFFAEGWRLIATDRHSKCDERIVTEVINLLELGNQDTWWCMFAEIDGSRFWCSAHQHYHNISVSCCHMNRDWTRQSGSGDRLIYISFSLLSCYVLFCIAVTTQSICLDLLCELWRNFS